MTVPESLDRLAMLDATFQHSPDVVALLGLDGRVFDVNQRALEFTGATLGEIVGTLLWETPGWSARPPLASWLESFVQSAGGDHTTLTNEVVVGPDGAMRTLQFAARTSRRSPSGVLWLEVVGRDITEQARVMAALREAEGRFRQLFEASTAMQLIANATTGALIDVNSAAEAFYGWGRESMRAMRITDFDDGALLARMVHDRVTDDQTRPVVCTHRIANGQKRDVEVAESPVIVDGVEALHLIVHDVTERVQSERDLRESETRFRAVINELSEGVVVHDVTGAIRLFNREAERLLGLSAEQLQGLQPTEHDWHAVREDGAPWPAIDHPAMRALRTGRRQPRALMGIRRGNLVHAWLQVTADPLILPGEPLPFASVAVFSDVTEQRHTDARLREAQKLDAVGQLAGGIAHDFNNLLTVIRGASGFLADVLEEGSPALADVRAIERATERAQILTSRLLAVGRRQMLRVETVDMSTLVQDQFEAIRNSVPPNIRLIKVLDVERVLARLDRQQALDALGALIDNARLAMPDGGTLTLSTAVRRAERLKTTADNASSRFAVLEVRDTGAGMTDEVRVRLFEPFFSTRPFGANHGMGLASVHGMVTQSHGYIECDSAPGQGTALRLFFPLATGAEHVVTPPGSSDVIQARRVLLVDDDLLLRDLASRMLERIGHDVVVAASGAEALELLGSSAATVSVLVTDLTMPVMNGMELIAEVERRHPDLPILAISGFSMHAAVRHELHTRAVTFLAKPFSADQLLQALEKVFAQLAPS